MPRIVVPLDQSALAEEALPWATLFARAIGDSIHLLSVTDKGKADEAATYLSGIAASIEGLTVTTEVVTDKDPAEAICDCSEAEATRMIVLTTHGKGGLKRAFQGSVGDKVARASTVPVLVDRSGGIPAAISRVLITLDGSENAEKALGPGREFAAASGAQVSLLRVYNPMAEYTLTPMGPATDLGEIAEKLFEAAEEYMKGIAQEGETWEVRSGRPLDVIIDFAAEKGCEVIIMSSHGRGGVIRLAIGSTSDSVIRAADRPVLLIPSPE